MIAGELLARLLDEGYHVILAKGDHSGQYHVRVADEGESIAMAWADDFDTAVRMAYRQTHDQAKAKGVRP